MAFGEIRVRLRMRKEDGVLRLTHYAFALVSYLIIIHTSTVELESADSSPTLSVIEV